MLFLRLWAAQPIAGGSVESAMIALSPPIHVWEAGSRKRTLTTVEGAAEFLVENWPEEFAGSALHQVAQQAALELLERGGKTWPFRSALEWAADEAGILAPRAPEPEKVLPGHIAEPWRYRRKRRR